MQFKFRFELEIKKYRLNLQITQKELAFYSGLSQSYIASLEKTDRTKSPTLNSICKIALALNVCPFQIIKCDGDCKNCKFFR